MAKKGLGKGLGAIFGEDVVKESKEELEKAKAKRAAAAEEIDEKGRILMLKLDLIQPNKEQPRKTFDEEQINELAGSSYISFLYEKIKITPVFMAPLLSLWC